MRRWLYRLGLLLGVGLLAAGTAVAITGYAATSGPDGAVRGYFAALARGDSAAALAFGDVPDGPHTLLTATVLREQQRIAPLRDITLGAIRSRGAHATVEVTYTVAFPNAGQRVHASIPVHRTGGGWRLDRTAVATELEGHGGLQRESIVGAAIPAGQTLLFPGALPVRFDTPYLQLDPTQDFVSFDAPPSTDIAVQPSSAGRSAMLAGARRMLRSCLARPQPNCPMPSGRYVPGSVRGVLQGGLDAPTVHFDSQDPIGTLRVSGLATVRGSYEQLNFHNIRTAGRGTLELQLVAAAYAVPPLRIRWTSP